jgi:uncharacterized membrane protein
MNTHNIVKSAIACFLALSSATTFMNTTAAATTEKMEKCYGIVKAGMNDCQTTNQSCAGSATKDKQADAFLFLPSGACKKIVGGSLTVITDNKTKS